YCHYMKRKWTLYNGILCSYEDYPPEFVSLVIQEMASNPVFLTGILEKNPEFPNAAKYIAYALEHDEPDIAANMFRSVIAHPDGRGKTLEDFISKTLAFCENWDELETVETFKSYILPIISSIEDKRIQRLIPRFKERIDNYIRSVESTCEQYQYSRRFAWRKTCADGSEYEVDPLNYETEEAYNDAILQRKYAWRMWHSTEAAQYSLALTDYETEADFEAAVAEAQKKLYTPKIKKTEADPLIDTSRTVYTFCGVTFLNSSTVYYYRTDNDSLDIGDMVVVPVGGNGKEEIAEIVTVEKHRRRTAPYPVDKAKFIKCRYTADDSSGIHIER
ncbi:MAG: hypothetical protein LUG92_07480, partial [Oscillospiraceae bacterium]|nr:hypothetical protein [Oscillospiraceae bacterium]